MKYFILILLTFLSIQSFAYTGDGGSSGGGGASGSWDDSCKQITVYRCDSFEGATPLAACQKSQSEYPIIFDASLNRCKLNGPFPKDSYTCVINTSVKNECSECPAGYEKDANGKCQPKKCPVGETLVNGQCQKKQCPAGQALDNNGNCMPRDDQCPAGQSMVNGRCKTDIPDSPDDPDAKLPPFCEWASVMCEWHKEWQQWSNDYNANEEKANLDREELKRLGLDSKEYLNEINQNSKEQLQQLKDHQIKLDEIKNQDKQFYDELRLWLKNFNPNDGNPSEQNPSIEFPKFCDWSVQMCNWYLDWKDWRSDYNAYNEVVKQKFDEHKKKLEDLEKLQQEQNVQDKKHYDETKDFQNDVRDFFDWYKNQKDESNPDDPNNQINPDPVEVKDNNVDFQPNENYVNATGSCPPDLVIPFRLKEGHEVRFSYATFCHGASLARPFVIFSGVITAFMIVSGFRGRDDA